MNACVTLPTGELRLAVHDSAFAVDELMGYAARANARRGFLFLSKVLGKHWPARPAAMRAIHASLARTIPAPALLPGPVVFIAMAETAIGLGQGVFEAYLEAYPACEALFVHTTRYQVEGAAVVEFEEAHSHAPRQFLHLPPDPALRALLLKAKSLVLVDDEASTGNTFLNLCNACRALNPGIERVHLAAITNFMGPAASAALSERYGLPVTLGAALHGAYSFKADPDAPPPPQAQAQRFEAEAERGASGCFGRFGLRGPLTVPDALARRLAAQVLPGQRVLVLGTGEFMHPSYLLGAALERAGVDVVVQSSTRSPILTWGAVSAAIAFPDNYGEGVANFIYNVTPGQYEHVLICHETPPSAALFEFAGALKARLFHFLSETQVEEIPVR